MQNFSEIEAMAWGFIGNAVFYAAIVFLIGVLFNKRGIYTFGYVFVGIAAICAIIGKGQLIVVLIIAALTVWILEKIADIRFGSTKTSTSPTPAPTPASPAAAPTATPTATPATPPIATYATIPTARRSFWNWAAIVIWVYITILMILGSLGFIFRGSTIIDPVARWVGAFLSNYYLTQILFGYRILLVVVLIIGILIIRRK